MLCCGEERRGEEARGRGGWGIDRCVLEDKGLENLGLEGRFFLGVDGMRGWGIGLLLNMPGWGLLYVMGWIFLSSHIYILFFDIGLEKGRMI